MKMEKGFFKVFNPETSAKRMKIPTGYTKYMNGNIPRKVSLRDRFDNVWTIGVVKQGRDFHFQYGWEKFIEDNNLEFEDFLIFDNDGKGTFEFKLLGTNECVKKGVGGKKKEDEMNVKHRKSVETKGKTWTSESSSSSSDDDSTEDYLVEEDDDEEMVEIEEEEETHEKAPCSKFRYVEAEEDDNVEGVMDRDGEDEETKKKDEEENERVYKHKKKVQHSKAGCKNATTSKVRDIPDYYGADIFKSGCATQPKNPYFVAKLREKRKNELFIPRDVVKDYQLELPPRIIIHDSDGRQFESSVKTWKDGRIWLVGGWRNLCRWNLVEKNDRCICEFVRGKCSRGIYLKVQVLHERPSSHPNNK